jgi:tetratricopeptide (TPR) repeat protein
MDRDELIVAISNRVDAFHATGEPEPMLAGEALGEARELSRWDNSELETAYCLGIFYHYRLLAAQRLGRAEPDQADVQAALSHLETVYRKAPDLLPPGMIDVCAAECPASAELIATWNSRATALLRMGRQRHDVDLIDDSVLLLRHVVANAGFGNDQAQAGYLSNLGLALRFRFLVADRSEDIAEALRVGAEAVDVAMTAEERRGFRSNLAIAYTARFERYGQSEDLDQAIDQLRLAIAGAEPGHPGRTSNLAAALASRFIITGDRADLDEAIALFGKAVDSARDLTERAEYLSNLAGAYNNRYTETGDTTDLERAVECAQDAVGDAGANPAALPAMRNNLGLALRSRYQRTRQGHDIDEAVQQFRSAVGALPHGHPERARYLSNLCSALRVRFDDSRSPADLDEAVARGREATESPGADYAWLARHYSNLSAVAAKRFTVTKAKDDLDEAVAAGRAAAELTPTNDPIRATILANLALALRRRAEYHDDQAYLIEVAETYATSAAIRSAPPLVRATSAQDCGEVHAGLGRWDAAVDAYEQAIGLLAEASDNRLATDDRRHHLTRLAGLGTAAAAAVLAHNDGEPARALALLERGRGVLLAQLLATRNDMTELHDRHEELAAEFQRLQYELNRDIPAGEGWTASRAARRERLCIERDQLIEKIRRIPGFTSFLLPRIDDEMLRSPVSGPVVAINLSDHRCDALVVSATGTQLIPLPKLTQAEATTQANALLTAVYDRDTGSDVRIIEVLRWMWDAFARDILDELGFGAAFDPRDAPRLWWMPTGALTVLPIHAAGQHDVAGQAVLDRVVSSYTATLRTLRQAHGRHVSRISERPLVVSVPEPPGRDPLPGARREARSVAHRLPAARSLVDDDASVERILRALPASSWVHFACHANTDPASPFDSHLVVQDGMLRVRDIAELRITEATLAYLSACTTAFGGTELSDEAIHISSAFQLAGYPHVIGTLWRVKDLAAATMTDRIYTELESRPPAAAVHTALHQLRDRYAESPYMWASHVHIGP